MHDSGRTPREDGYTQMDRHEFLTRSALVGASIAAAGRLALPDISSAATGNILWGANRLPRAGQRDQQEAVQSMSPEPSST
jgi:hypothetical protein